jgi:hypothetical protein
VDPERPTSSSRLHRLTGRVAEWQANVLEVSHNRVFSRVNLDETVVDLTVETRAP